MQVFRNDEAGYRTWLERNPDGYVLQSFVDYKGEYQCLHTANCWTISRPDENYTSGDFVKTVSESMPELRQFAMQKFGEAPPECSKCIGRTAKV